MQKKSVSRICAPVKMQINLFVRSTGLVSALFGAVGHRRALPSAAAQLQLRGAGHPLGVRGSRVCKALAREHQLQPNVLQRFLRVGTDFISPEHNEVTSSCLIQVRAPGEVPHSCRSYDNGHMLYCRHQLCQMAAGFGLAVLRRHSASEPAPR